jgi:hypothetical protein
MRLVSEPPYSSLRRLAGGWGGEELVDQVAVGAVDLQDVETGLMRAGRSLAPMRHNASDFIVVEGARGPDPSPLSRTFQDGPG